ncbi:Pyruvate kinase [Podila epicladia]|nr:Pyruvate kinase [Podila epicladia]
MFDDNIKTDLEWTSSLDIDYQPSNIRKTSIICTIGPKTNNVEMINKLRDAGMNIARMNFSHGSYEYHQSVIDNVRQSAIDHPGRPVGIALDTKGPEIRKVIYVDDGVLSFKVLEVEDDHVKVEAINNGKICSRKGVNLPKTEVDLPALSEKDKKDLQFGVQNNVDIIFASFIRRADDVREIRKVLGEEGKHIKIISKIENHQGVMNFDEILEVTDGVMVARGDLGIEIPCTQVFIAQKMMIAKCNLAGKPVICATQMLESMTYNPRPTRAEVSDVANAVLDGADCVMLSGETAKGNYPLEAVATMAETCVLAESAICYPPLFNELRQLQKRPTETTETVASSAVSASQEQNAGAIVVLSTSGDTARLVSKYRPQSNIIIVTRRASTARAIHLSRGCYPFVYTEPKVADWQEDVDNRLRWGMDQAIKEGLIKSGQTVIVIQGFRSGYGNTNTMRIVIA